VTAVLPVLASFVFPPNPARAAAPPNLVTILADDAGFADVSFTHSLFIADPAQRPAEVRTLNIDALAQAGIIYSNGCMSGNVCPPGH
jgi:arylsulfatase A-like enzyme